MKSPEIFVFLYITEMSFHLERTYLAVQDSFLTQGVCTGFHLVSFMRLPFSIIQKNRIGPGTTALVVDHTGADIVEIIVQIQLRLC